MNAFQYYQFLVKLDRCARSFNTLNNLSHKLCIPNKTEDLNLTVFKVIADINELKTLTKDISDECKCKFDGTNVILTNGGITINVDVSVKNIICEKDYVWNTAKCICENGKYLASIMDDSVITCDEVIESYDEEIKTILNEKIKLVKHIVSIFCLPFYYLHCIIDSCWYLLSFDKVSKKKKKQKHSLHFVTQN